MANQSMPNLLSVIPLRTQVIFPNTSVAFDAGRGLSLAAIERADTNGKLVFITKQKTDKEVPEIQDLHEIGTVARIKQTTRLPGDRLRVYAEGLYRARARGFRVEKGYICTVADKFAPFERIPRWKKRISARRANW